MLTTHMDKLHIMAEALMKYETIDANQVKEIMDGKEVTPPEDWEESDDDDSNDSVNKAEKDTESDDPVIGGEATES